jgi:zinc transport system substrate-binding protein
MKKISFLLLLVLLVSCKSGHNNKPGERIITVSIAPFGYFVEAIAGNDFSVNVMVPPGSDPHVYEPVPEQISRLRSSEGYISNGYLGFEMAWLDRFYEANPGMKKLNLGESINPISSEEHHEHGMTEGADPHYWVSPKCAASISQAIKAFLDELNPSHSGIYEKNYSLLMEKITALDSRADSLFSGLRGKAFMIYHPNLAYLARDYGLREVAVESEGKEPSPSQMKELIDMVVRDSMKAIFVQREFDKRNARTIAGETGAELVIIDPLSADWYSATSEIIDDLYRSLIKQ